MVTRCFWLASEATANAWPLYVFRVGRQRHDVADRPVLHHLLVALRKVVEDHLAHRLEGLAAVVGELGEIALDGDGIAVHWCSLNAAP